MMTLLTSFVPFLILFALATATMHYFLFVRIVALFDLSRRQKPKRFLGGLLIFLFILVFLARVADFLLPSEIAAPITWVGSVWLGALLITCCIILLTWGVSVCLDRWPVQVSASPHQAMRRQWLHRVLGTAALVSAGAVSARALENALGQVQVKTVDIALSRLPLPLRGFKLVQLTDLHIGYSSTAPKAAWLRDIVSRVNALDADLITITGDLVDGSVHRLRDDVAPLAGLRAKQGVYFVPGNHEYYSGIEEWLAHLPTLGIQVLRNRHITLFADQPWAIDLAGVDDYKSSRFVQPGHDMAAALAGRTQNRLVILLAHQPASVYDAARYGVDLQISGHTHGGQIWPFGMLVRIQQPYVAGLHQHPESNTQIYVSRGTGYWGPPMRLGNDAEITCMILNNTPVTQG